MLKNYRFIKRFSFFICLFFSINVFGTSMISYDDIETEALVHDCVAVKTGEYCEKNIDLVVDGPDNIEIIRYYNSCNSATNLDGWRMFSQCILLEGDKKQQKTEKYIYCGEKTGSIFSYSSSNVNEFKIDMKGSLGLSNNVRKISGQTNYKNNQIIFDNDEKLYILKTGNGTTRVYKPFEFLKKLKKNQTFFEKEIFHKLENSLTNPQYYYLDHEILPSGNKIFYEYDTTGQLIKIESKNALEDNIFGWVNIDYESLENKGEITINASDNQFVKYYFDDGKSRNNDRYLLEKVESTKNPDVEYFYSKNGKYLLKKNFPEKRFIELEYNLEENSQTFGRVTKIKVPSNNGNTSVDLYKISYDLNIQKNGLVKSQTTKVTNSKNASWLYCLNSDLLIEAIKKYDDKGMLYYVNRKKWGKKCHDRCLLLERHEDNQEKVLKCRTFIYDSQGNVIEEFLYGNLTGKSPVPVNVNSRGLPTKNNNEFYRIQRSYSKDGFNLIVQEGEKKGSLIKYKYYPKTNLLKQNKKSFLGKKSKKYSYTYDNNGSLVEKREQGAKRDLTVSNAYGVDETVSYITELQVKSTLPSVGKPLIIIEKCLTSKKGQIIIKKTKNSYDERGNIASSESFSPDEALLEAQRYEHDERNNIISITDKNGEKIKYAYDSNNNLLLEDKGNKIKEFKYDWRNNLIQKVTKYSPELCLLKIMTSDEFGNIISKVDTYGNETIYEYDCFSRLVKIKYPKIEDENGSLVCPEYHYKYDNLDNLIETRDPKGFYTRKNYNIRSQPTINEHPDGSKEIFSYDLQGSCHRKLDRNEFISIYEFDWLGRMIKEERFTKAEKGPGYWLGEREYQYDDFYFIGDRNEAASVCYKINYAGQILSEYSPQDIYVHENKNGFKNEFSYDSLGRRIVEKKWYGNNKKEFYFIKKKYDKFNNVVEEKIENAEKETQVIKKYVYDKEGRLCDSYLGDDVVQKYVYNELGKITQFEDAQKNVFSFHYNLNHKNSLGQNVLLTTSYDPNGDQTITIYNSNGLIQEIIKKNCQAQTIAHEKYKYDLLGNLAQKEDVVFSDGIEIKTNVVKWIYGPMNRLETLIEGFGTEDEKITRFEYDQSSRLIKKFVPGIERPIVFSYEKKGERCSVNISYPRLEIKEGSTSEVKYNDYYKLDIDRFGNVTYAESENSRVRRSFGEGNLSILKQETIKVCREDEYKIRYEHDRLGRVTKVILPDSSKILYNYNGYFPRNVVRLDKKGNEIYRHVYDSFDLKENLLTETLIGDAGKREHGYDGSNRKISIKTEFEELMIPQGGFDAQGNILKICRDSEEKFFSYDDLSRITGEIGSNNHSYKNDSLNNVIQIDDQHLYFNEMSELLSFGGNEYNYDKRGCITSSGDENKQILFKSNAFGHLEEIESPQKWKIRYTYDVFGRRLYQEVEEDGEKYYQKYLYLGNQEVGLIENDNSISQMQIPGAYFNLDTGRSIAFELKEGIFAPNYDFQGNVLSLIDSYYSEIAESYDYSAYGKETILDSNGDELASSLIGNPWRYAAKRKEFRTGLINFGLRDYDPNLGRWINPDPLGFIDGMNKYVFVHSNPLKYIDLLGTSSYHYYKKSASFEEYFYDDRTIEKNKGGDVFLFGGQVFVVNEHFELSENFKNLLSDSIKVAADLADATLGLLELSTGLIGLGGATGLEIGTLGGGTAVAVPVAAGSIVLVADGAVRIGNGYALFRKTSKNFETFERKKPGNMQKQVEKKQAPKSVRRVDKGRGSYEKDHVHFEDGSALNTDGTWKHGNRELTRSEINWLIENGWKIPLK